VSFQSKQRKRLATYALERYGVTGHVLPYELVSEMLHESYQERTLAYFAKHRIKWWSSRYDVGRPALAADGVGAPTGHLNSSQVAAVNHLEPARLDEALARQVLANVEPTLIEPTRVEDGGFVAYEWQPYARCAGHLARRAHVRSPCRRRPHPGRVRVEYVESYGRESRAISARGTDRVAIYRPLLERTGCPIAIADPAHLFFDPYEQLMRQTLLVWQMVEHGEFGATDWIHVHVVPEGNVALRGRSGAAPNLAGATMAEAWQSVLTEPGRYRLMTATALLDGVGEHDWSEWRAWLRERYLT
jgi:hypothetical protein